MKNNKMLAIMLVVCVAIAAPALATHIEYTGASGGFWSNDNNWTFYGNDENDVSIVVTPYTPDADGEKVEVVGGLVCNLDSITNDLDNMELYAGGVLNILEGGVLTVDGELGIYGSIDTGHSDYGTAIYLLGGTIRSKANNVYGAEYIFGLDGKNSADGGVNIEAGTGDDAGYTLYTAVPLPCGYTEEDALLKGDTNYDCEVNLVDFAALASNWMTNESLVDESSLF
jgi:hypothetical protein